MTCLPRAPIRMRSPEYRNISRPLAQGASIYDVCIRDGGGLWKSGHSEGGGVNFIE